MLLDGLAFRAWALIRSRREPGEEYAETQAELAARLGRSVRPVNEAIATLKSVGFLRRERETPRETVYSVRPFGSGAASPASEQAPRSTPTSGAFSGSALHNIYSYAENSASAVVSASVDSGASQSTHALKTADPSFSSMSSPKTLGINTPPRIPSRARGEAAESGGAGSSQQPTKRPADIEAMLKQAKVPARRDEFAAFPVDAIREAWALAASARDRFPAALAHLKSGTATRKADEKAERKARAQAAAPKPTMPAATGNDDEAKARDLALIDAAPDVTLYHAVLSARAALPPDQQRRHSTIEGYAGARQKARLVTFRATVAQLLRDTGVQT